mmetsp:Transcript_5134/g.9333  ORF Transcript_5134/g.9333 Transcript_5134/m.9333 type:complete len:92 (-) Transcript_5134:70-345(-)
MPLSRASEVGDGRQSMWPPTTKIFAKEEAWPSAFEIWDGCRSTLLLRGSPPPRAECGRQGRDNAEDEIAIPRGYRSRRTRPSVDAKDMTTP